MDRESLKAGFRKVVAVAAFIAKWTPNQYDDAICTALQKVADDDQLLDTILDLLGVKAGLPITVALASKNKIEELV